MLILLLGIIGWVCVFYLLFILPCHILQPQQRHKEHKEAQESAEEEGEEDEKTSYPTFQMWESLNARIRSLKIHPIEDCQTFYLTAESTRGKSYACMFSPGYEDRKLTITALTSRELGSRSDLQDHTE